MRVPACSELCVLLFCGALATRAEEPLSKTSGRDLTFSVSFDGKSTAADVAAGDPVSTTFHDNLEFRLVPGMDGKNAFNRMVGDTLKYNVAGNVSARKGTAMMWLKALQYAPNGVRMSDTNLCHKSYLWLRFDNEARWVDLFFYQYYNDSRAMFYWNSSEMPERGYKLAAGSLLNIGRDEWFHVAGVWDEKEIRIYVNGALQASVQLPYEAQQAAPFVPDPAKSFIGVRECMFGKDSSDLTFGKETAIDDIRIYSRPLSSAEIRVIYAASGAVHVRPTASPADAVDLQFHGMDDGKGDLNRLEVDLDFNPLADALRQAVEQGQARVDYALTAPSGTTRSGRWEDIRDLRITRFLGEITEPGEYSFRLTVTDPNGKTATTQKTFQRPDTSWFGNSIGLEDTVPEPWTPVRVDEHHTVRIWNRAYAFDTGPFPCAITNGNDALLTRPPRLVIETPDGPAEVAFSITGKTVNASSVLFTGEGRAKTFTLSWQTRVEFDGFIRTDFAFHGVPTVSRMTLTWTVDRRFSDYLMDPLLSQSGDGDYERKTITQSTGQRGYQIWLTSRQKGFCWAPENDANWVYGPDDNLLRVRVSPEGGACEIRMITRDVAIPEGATYSALFIATPSRPLPKRNRTFRLGGYGRYSNCDVAMVQHVGEGMEGVFSLRPNAHFGAVMADLLALHMTNLIPYAAATGLSDFTPEGKYFGKYWDIGGMTAGAWPIRPYQKTPDEGECLHINCAPHTAYSDFIIWNMKNRLFTHPDQRYVGMYYDLCNNFLGANELNGLAFTDAFGRHIRSYILMGLRRHCLRTLRVCRSFGGITILHGHSAYNPMIHGFGDYWYPGEQYTSKMLEKKTAFYYSDFITDDEYFSELNMHLRGSGILFLGNLSRANKTYGTTEQTEAMCGALLLHDVPMAIAFEDGNVINRIWGIALRYSLDSARCVLFDDPRNRIRSDNPQIQATYYLCADGRILVMVCNRSAQEQTGRLDFSALKKNLTAVREEYRETELPVENGQVRLTLPPRLFSILGF